MLIGFIVDLIECNKKIRKTTLSSVFTIFLLGKYLPLRQTVHLNHSIHHALTTPGSIFFVQPYAKRALRVPKTGREIQFRGLAVNDGR
jgi:hypothetical protein